MNIYLIERTDNTNYNECIGFVICAENEQKCRQLASESSEDEGRGVWNNDAQIKLIGTSIDDSINNTIILCDFREG